MCLILDTNKYGEFFDPTNRNMEPVRQWYKKMGKFVYTPTPKMMKELAGNDKMRQLFSEGRRTKKVKWIDEKKEHKKEKELTKEVLTKKRKLKSNDLHIIALALAGEVKLLVSGDKNLHADFKDIIEKGNIYQNKAHKHLLAEDICP